MKLLIRMNVKRRIVEIKFSEETDDDMNLNRAFEFLKAFMLGF